MILGGERLGAHLLAQWRELGVQTRVLNAYGPTEGIITATLSEVGEERGLVTIGRPLPGRKVYVLDQAGQPVPVGAVGELYVGGDLLARGYLNRPDLTDERFVADPFDPGGPGRLYRTGDRARYLDDGRIVYLGRVDDQVKIRGYRIELGEVEAAMPSIPRSRRRSWWREGTARTRSSWPTSWRARNEAILEEELRRHLEAKLPRAMQPSIIAELATMPRLATGKPDRRGLPEVGRTRRRDPSSYVPPKSLVHEHLIQIWEELLEARPIGIRDNFFHLGGHSLLAAQVVQRMEQVLGKRPTLSTLFANPTIEQLVESLEPDGGTGLEGPGAARTSPGGSHAALLLARGLDRRRVLLSRSGTRLWGRSTLLRSGYRTVSTVKRAPPTVEAIARAHIDAIRQVRGPGPTGSAASATAACWPTKWRASWKRTASRSNSWASSTRRCPRSGVC